MPVAKRPFTVTRADHTGFTVSSLEVAIHLWVDVLGFHLVSRERYTGSFVENVVGVKGADVAAALVEAPGHRIELLEYLSPADRQSMKPRSCDVGSVHIAFIVDDLDAVLFRLEESGWRSLGATQTVQGGEREGTRLVYVRGPDGITIEFLEPGITPAAG